MKLEDWIAFLFIHVVVPILGIICYILLVKKMKKDEIPQPPTAELFWVFGTYGVVLILILTSLFWKWSGMASIGFFASMIIGSIILGITAISTYRNRKLTKYHLITFWLSAGYIGFISLVVSASVFYNTIK